MVDRTVSRLPTRDAPGEVAACHRVSRALWQGGKVCELCLCDLVGYVVCCTLNWFLGFDRATNRLTDGFVNTKGFLSNGVALMGACGTTWSTIPFGAVPNDQHDPQKTSHENLRSSFLALCALQTAGHCHGNHTAGGLLRQPAQATWEVVGDVTSVLETVNVFFYTLVLAACGYGLAEITKRFLLALCARTHAVLCSLPACLVHCMVAAARAYYALQTRWRRGSRVQKGVFCLVFLLLSACALSPLLAGTSSSKKASLQLWPLRHRTKRKRRRPRRRKTVGFTDDRVRGTTAKRGDNHFSSRGGISSSFLIGELQQRRRYLTRSELLEALPPPPAPVQADPPAVPRARGSHSRATRRSPPTRIVCAIVGAWLCTALIGTSRLGPTRIDALINFAGPSNNPSRLSRTGRDGERRGTTTLQRLATTDSTRLRLPAAPAAAAATTAPLQRKGKGAGSVS